MLDDVEGMKHHTGKIGHAHIKIFGNDLFLSDKTDHEIVVGNNFHFTMALDKENDLRHTFALLAEDGVVFHPLKELFWCELSCYVKDKFGIVWSLYIGLK